MQILNLKLLDFRNYERLSISFNEHLNIIYGKNGSGKTNLVEAIYVLALTRSFKQVHDKTLIRQTSTITKIEGKIKNRYQNTFQVIIADSGKTVKIDDNKMTKISDYISKINVVLFNPNDLRMIKDSPSIRRKYLNIVISQLDVRYLKQLNHYNKLVKMRNAYLKQMYLNGTSKMEYLDVITEKLIDVGCQIYESRKTFFETLNSTIGDIYSKITSSGLLQVKYLSHYANKTSKQLKEHYKKNLSRDIALGKTNFGVHHDDFLFYLNDYDLKDYGSEGQQKNAVIAWKFSEIEIFKKVKQITPLLILDDLLSELDVEKIENIFTFIDESIQTFITTTEIEKVLPLLNNKKYKKIYVSNGQLEEVL